VAAAPTRGRLAFVASMETRRSITLDYRICVGSSLTWQYEDEIFVREGVQFGPSLRRSAGCDALIAWRYSVQLQKSALMLLILRPERNACVKYAAARLPRVRGPDMGYSRHSIKCEPRRTILPPSRLTTRRQPLASVLRITSDFLLPRRRYDEWDQHR